MISGLCSLPIMALPVIVFSSMLGAWGKGAGVPCWAVLARRPTLAWPHHVHDAANALRQDARAGGRRGTWLPASLSRLPPCCDGLQADGGGLHGAGGAPAPTLVGAVHSRALPGKWGPSPAHTRVFLSLWACTLSAHIGQGLRTRLCLSSE